MIQDACHFLNEIGLTIEIFKEHILTLVGPEKQEQFNALSTQIKTAFTKSFNTLYKSSIKATKKGKGTKDIIDPISGGLCKNIDADEDQTYGISDDDDADGS